MKKLIIYIFILIIPIFNTYSLPTIHRELKDVIANDHNEMSNKLSLNYQNISVRAALQLLAQFAHFNIVISDSVNGYLTLNLKNVTWKQAFDIILKTQHLLSQRINGTITIASFDEIAKQKQGELAANNQLLELAQLHMVLIPINYANADSIAAILQQQQQGATILSKRGNVGVDSRTNTLWLQDTPEKIFAITKLVHQLDVPVKQVLISARIVNVDKNFEQELGVRWNIGSATTSMSNATLSNNSGSSTNNAQAAVLPTMLHGMRIDLPTVNFGQAKGTSLGFLVAKLTDGVLLDLELSALESQGYADIIATPQIVTANQKEAIIEAGEEIPYQYTTESGTTSITFKKAVLSLRVTPQITPDNRIIINLTVNQDKRGAEVVQGVPTIDTRVIQTQVLLNNGQTIVLGGIYQQNSSKNFDKVPFLSELPLFGNLFKHRHQLAQQRELLVFVTPKIINQ